MIGRSVRLRLEDLDIGMVVKRDRTWLRIEHIGEVDNLKRRKATVTTRNQLRPGAFTVYFTNTSHKVLSDSLPVDFAIKPKPAATTEPEPTFVAVPDYVANPGLESEEESEPTVQRDVTNIIEGTVHGPTIQAGTIGGQVVSDFFKRK